MLWSQWSGRYRWRYKMKVGFLCLTWLCSGECMTASRIVLVLVRTSSIPQVGKTEPGSLVVRETSYNFCSILNHKFGQSQGRRITKTLLFFLFQISVLMGFTWIFGYIATFTGVEALWYVFIILNSSQGFFVFLANTCNRRVYQCYKRALCRRGNRVRPEVAPLPAARQ